MAYRTSKPLHPTEFGDPEKKKKQRYIPEMGATVIDEKKWKKAEKASMQGGIKGAKGKYSSQKADIKSGEGKHKAASRLYRKAADKYGKASEKHMKAGKNRLAALKIH